MEYEQRKMQVNFPHEKAEALRASCALKNRQLSINKYIPSEGGDKRQLGFVSLIKGAVLIRCSCSKDYTCEHSGVIYRDMKGLLAITWPLLQPGGQ